MIEKQLQPAERDAPQATIPEDLLPPREVCRRLKVGKTALYEWLSRGDIAHTRVGRLIRIREADVAAYLARNAAPIRERKHYARYPTA